MLIISSNPLTIKTISNKIHKFIKIKQVKTLIKHNNKLISKL